MVRTRRIKECDWVIFVFVEVPVVTGDVTKAMDMVFPATAGKSLEAPMTTDKHKQAIVMTRNIKNGKLAPPSKINGNNIWKSAGIGIYVTEEVLTVDSSVSLLRTARYW